MTDEGEEHESHSANGEDRSKLRTQPHTHTHTHTHRGYRRRPYNTERHHAVRKLAVASELASEGLSSKRGLVAHISSWSL